ncbi:MAG: hypothetical protein ABI723_18205 [Bacteroidia bacterium]
MKLRQFFKIFFVVVGLMSFYCSAQGQFLDTLVSSFHQPHKLFFTIDLSKSFGVNNGTDIIGFKLGSAQNQRIYYGLGYYILNTDVVKDKTVQKYDGTDTVVPSQLKLRFVTLNAEYVFYRDNHWQFGAPVNIGYGKSYYEYHIAKGQKEKTTKTGSMLFSLGFAGQYKFIPWVGLGFGVGHAGTLGTNKNDDQNFSAWTYSFGIKIFFDEIYRTLRDLKKSDKEKGKPIDDDGPVPDFKN